MDAQLYVPVGGVMQWLDFAADVPAEQVQGMSRYLVWDMRTSALTELHSPVQPTACRLTPADEYAVWMQYPVTNGKVPFGLIAHRVPPESATLFLTGLVRKVSVQPMRGSQP